MSKVKIGDVFTRWTVLAQAPYRSNSRAFWHCRCQCGSEKQVSSQALRTGVSKSCGCYSRDRDRRTHGLTKTPEHSIWVSMKQRCSNPKAVGYHNYGGRGISVCKRWSESFECFLADMGVKPTKNHSLDRKENDGDYTPDNCRWATMSEQLSNTRRSRNITFRGETFTLREWAKRQSLPETTLRNRIEAGWSMEKAMLSPIHETSSRANKVMISKRGRSYAERLASVLLLMRRGDGSLLIPPEVAAKGTKAILAHVEWDHIHPVALGGDNHHTNLQPLTTEDHLAKTKRDVKAIAKTKRLTKKEAEFRARLLTPRDEREPKQSRWASRPFPKRRKAL